MMNVNELTLPNIYEKEKTKPKGKRYELTFADGLSIRVSTKGLFTWQYRYRLNGRQHRVDLGHYPETGVSKVLSTHKAMKEKVKNGIDPRDDVAQEIRLVSDICKYWYENYALEQRKRPEIAQRAIEVDIIPELGHKSLEAIRALDIHRCLRKIVRRGSKTQAIKTLNLLKQIFNYAESIELIDKSPVASIRKKDICSINKKNDRCLNDDELRILLKRLDENVLSEQFSLATKILLYTGQRRGEIRLTEWKEIDLVKGTWFIPAEKNKSDRDHYVILSPSVSEFFCRLKSLSEDSNWVIPNLKDKTKPYSERALTRAINRTQDKFGLEKWRPHDLRRTFITGVNNLGNQLHVTEKVVNHVLEGILKIYDTGDYMEQREATMLLWDNHLTKLSGKRKNENISE